MKKSKLHEELSNPASSPLLTMQLLNKETEKKEAAAEAKRVRCPICFNEIIPAFKCKCSGGGSRKKKKANSDKKETDKSESPSNQLIKKIVEPSKELMKKFNIINEEEFLLQLRADEKSFDSEIIAALVEDGLLIINNDRESMKLTISLQCKPNFLSEKQREELAKFTHAVLKELIDFKAENQISDKCAEIIQDEEGNIIYLDIKLTSLDLYDKFIQRLANNLLPTPAPKLDELTVEKQKTQSIVPTPFSLEPKPGIKNSEKKEEERGSPTPFNIKPKISD